ncbi:MAG: alpha/beta hydrolase [Bacteroidota bacterium]
MQTRSTLYFLRIPGFNRSGFWALICLFLFACSPQAQNSTNNKQSTSDPVEPLLLTPTTETFFPEFEELIVTIDSLKIYAVKGGSGPPLLLLHGAPESHVMWRKLGPELAKNFTVIAPDLRGYGRSDKPFEADYSKRRMAADQVELMEALGYDQFLIASHDRGSHVARRLAKDYPGKVKKMILMDIIPATYVWTHINEKVANRYWSWLFWSQPYPIPEKLMGPQAGDFARMTTGEDVEAGNDYAATNGSTAAFHAMCEDYRASKNIDIDHDLADANVKITTPTLVIWGEKSNTAALDYPEIWNNEVEKVAFLELDCGHFVVEEQPDEILNAILSFF